MEAVGFHKDMEKVGQKKSLTERRRELINDRASKSGQNGEKVEVVLISKA